MDVSFLFILNSIERIFIIIYFILKETSCFFLENVPNRSIDRPDESSVLPRRTDTVMTQQMFVIFSFFILKFNDFLFGLLIDK